MQISIGHLNHKFIAQVTEYSADELSWLREFITFQTVEWVRGERRVINTCYLSSVNNTFPLGLVPSIQRYGEKDGLTIEILDYRDFSKIPPQNIVDHSWLRDYQQAVVDRCYDAKFGIISSPVGSGKSKMITAFAERFGGNILVGVSDPTLVRDLIATYTHHTGEIPGKIITEKGKFVYEPKRVTYCSFPAIYGKLNQERVSHYLSQVDAFLVDECHEVAAKTITACANKCRGTLYRFGFSGTPLDRSDGRSIAVMANLGPCRVDIPMSFLIENGYVAQGIVRFVQCEHPSRQFFNYHQAYKALIVKSPTRIKLCRDIMLAQQKPGFVFIKEKNHGITLEAVAKRLGINALYVDGDAPPEYRKQILETLRRSDIDLVISTKIFYKGVDVPQLRSVFNASGGKSTIDVIQRMGRGVRKVDANDTTFEMWDIMDVGNRWLEDHSNQRAAIYERVGAKIFRYKNIDELE